MGEAYVDGDIESDDLTAVLRVLARNLGVSTAVDGGVSSIARWRDILWHCLRSNTIIGSRRNIAAHYDLSNEFFATFLDPTMTYSCGVFEQPDATMQQASLSKYARICQKLRLQPSDRVLEIGSGWGGFARYAALNVGCHVTSTTISQNQFEYTRRSLEDAGIDDRVTLLQRDYRQLEGRFDKLVSIEMIEAVGERYLPVFFNKCCELLRPDGAMLLQAITIPDHRYDHYRRSVDFIQKHVFPGGFLPCSAAIGDCLRRQTDFRMFSWEEIGPHYAKTLRRWRQAFRQNVSDVRALGFDDRFVRLWEYYLRYCEAGFAERQIGAAQLVLTKPASRLPDFIQSPLQTYPARSAV
ncbi:MAG: cyclopropane-fatty-acyl-phospholipid synthase family protein [Pirellulales bacterium]